MKNIKTQRYIKAQEQAQIPDVFNEDGTMARNDSVEREVIEQNEGPQFVSVYQVERAFGGPEEGGWWYDTYQLVDSKPVATSAAAKVVKEFLQEKYSTQNEETGPLSSSKGFESLPEGTEDYQIPKGFSGGTSEIVVLIEDTPGENTTTETPHYE
jgi:hypothetical protein